MSSAQRSKGGGRRTGQRPTRLPGSGYPAGIDPDRPPRARPRQDKARAAAALEHAAARVPPWQVSAVRGLIALTDRLAVLDPESPLLPKCAEALGQVPAHVRHAAQTPSAPRKASPPE